ncbi:hypothetical protein M0Q28_06935 [Patescibacteria group bacterium]|jgi:hypothetical protein|nr:hypothetical protein [Patescibacteria group bacterium]
MKLFGVLTGDLVRSRDLSAGQQRHALGALSDMAGEFSRQHEGLAVGKLEVFRGDSWQFCLERPELAVEAAVFLRAGLIAAGLDSRIAIGIGSVKSLDKRKISRSSGPAFEASGHGLDSLPKKRRLGLAFADGVQNPSADSLMGAVIPLIDAQMEKWTSREAFAVYGTLRGLTQQEIAELPEARTVKGVQPTRQAIHDALARIQWHAILHPVLETIRGLVLGRSARV